MTALHFGCRSCSASFDEDAMPYGVAKCPECYSRYITMSERYDSHPIEQVRGLPMVAAESPAQYWAIVATVIFALATVLAVKLSSCTTERHDLHQQADRAVEVKILPQQAVHGQAVHFEFSPYARYDGVENFVR